MTDQHRMEALSRAYAQAIAALCGCTCARPEPDYGIDLLLRRVIHRHARWREEGLALNVQLKSEAGATIATDRIIHDLKADAYDLLRRSTRRSPAILVLLALPANRAEWIDHSEDRLELRRYVLAVASWIPGQSEQIHGTDRNSAREPVHTSGTDADNGSSSATGGHLMTEQRMPTPKQIRVWLNAHGWTPEDPMPEDLVIFTYKEPADDGQSITVYVPGSVEETLLYPLRVRDVVVTAAGMEDRPEADVLAEMLATNATPVAPAVPVQQSPPVPAA